MKSLPPFRLNKEMRIYNSNPGFREILIANRPYFNRMAFPYKKS